MLKMIGICTLMISILCSPVYGKCSFKTIKKVEGGYLYTPECNIEVGRLYELKMVQSRLIELEAENVEKWRKRAIESENRTNYPVWVSYGLGVVATLASVWAAGKVSK